MAQFVANNPGFTAIIIGMICTTITMVAGFICMTVQYVADKNRYK